MVRVLYDHTIFTSQRYGGISRYFAELLPRLGEHDVAATAFMGLHVHGYDLHRQRERLARLFAIERPIKRKTRWLAQPINDWMFRRYAQRRRTDVYHPTSYLDLIPSVQAKRVITVHDFIADRLNLASLPDAWRPATAVRSGADGYICISESTRRDLLELCDVPAERTTVVYHANSLRIPGPLKRPIAADYLLFVGGRWDYKNFGTLLEAYASAAAVNSRMHLLCFGLPPSKSELERAEKLVPGKVHFTGGPDEALAAAYANASAFVYPSLYEGFGIPMLEAMHYRCPVVASNTSCFPEIAGDAAVYFDPRTADDLAAVLTRVLDDAALRQTMIERGVAREAEFSWDRAARETADFYRRVAG